jgi:2-keto-3-deoxy-L-rhamnonate aldolase RhmA
MTNSTHIHATESVALMERNPLGQKLASGELALALICKQARTPDIALAAKTCGYDVLYFDLQHSTLSSEVASQLCLAALGAGITPMVRVPQHDYGLAARLLDSGALAACFPDVRCKEDAQRAVDACKFAPVGQRSGSLGWPHFSYRPVPAREARNALNENTAVVLMVESMRGVEEVEAIAAVPGVDVIHVGCGDLASDLGHAGDKAHVDVLAAIDRVATACRLRGVVMGLGGISSIDPQLLHKFLAFKPGLITAANEWSAMMESLRKRAALFRNLELSVTTGDPALVGAR